MYVAFFDQLGSFRLLNPHVCVVTVSLGTLNRLWLVASVISLLILLSRKIQKVLGGGQGGRGGKAPTGFSSMVCILDINDVFNQFAMSTSTQYSTTILN